MSTELNPMYKHGMTSHPQHPMSHTHGNFIDSLFHGGCNVT